MQLGGIHHVTAVTADAARNRAFYTGLLGMRLVKKTVNQDDTTAYHLFYADRQGSPGTDLTFFDWRAAPERRGTRSVTRTGLRIGNAASLAWWRSRLVQAGVALSEPVDRAGRTVLDFEDPEGQRLSLMCDPGGEGGQPWEASPVPPGHQIRGLGPVTMSVDDLGPTEAVLTTVMNMRQVADYPHPEQPGRKVHVFAMGPGGAAAELHVAVEPDAPPARLGRGGVHHVAFRTPNGEEYNAWAERLQAMRVPNSGPVDRFYFQSLYFREPGGILFEIATDGPGFAADEPLETLGERLALPPFLESRRAAIEAGLKPLQRPSARALTPAPHR